MPLDECQIAIARILRLDASAQRQRRFNESWRSDAMASDEWLVARELAAAAVTNHSYALVRIETRFLAAFNHNFLLDPLHCFAASEFACIRKQLKEGTRLAAFFLCGGATRISTLARMHWDAVKAQRTLTLVDQTLEPGKVG